MAHEQDRRNFLKLLGAGSLAATSFSESIRRALAIPANNRTGTIQDVEHIVILMQENRSFDHYLGTLSGVRGYNDPRVARFGNGQPVWYQPDGAGGTVLPFRPDAPDLGLVFIEDLAHDWDSTHAAWNGGLYDQWVPQKGTTTMAHLTRADIPFHYALADAFTVCDAYHCSLLGPTDPNRYHMFTGWVGNDGTGGGPVLDNAEAGYSWSTYPERLQAAGISWKVYQDVGEGLTQAAEWGYAGTPYAGNYGDNSLLYFFQYQDAPASSPLSEFARTGTNIDASGTLFDQFRADINAGTLPSVSWIVAPEAYCEHPNWCANFGAWYVSEMLDALTSNPELCSKTAFFITYDENDGFFDHAVPPTPPRTRAEGISTVDTINEIFPGNADFTPGPIGLGARVPMWVVSPWSRGGFVNSQVFDHTSLIRFIEARFGTATNNLVETNITPWRRAVSGDLTSAFDFANPNRSALAALPPTAAYQPPNQDVYPDYVPTVPTAQSLPKQEKGVRPARALPYALEVTGAASASGALSLSFANSGVATAVFQVRAGNGLFAPLTYTVGAGKIVSDGWNFPSGTVLDAAVLGPNGFLRHFGGTLGTAGALVEVEAATHPATLSLAYTLANRGSAPLAVVLTEGYSGRSVSVTLDPGETVSRTLSAAATLGWYDLKVTAPSDSTFVRHLAGHIENGRDSITDPAIGLDVANAV